LYTSSLKYFLRFIIIPGDTSRCVQTESCLLRYSSVHTGPVLAKHSKSFNLIDTLAVGVDRIQRNFEPMQRQVEQWRNSQISDERAKLILYEAFVDGELEAPRSLLPDVHRLYFEPEYPEFSPRTMWSLSNAFTSAFKKLDPIPQFKATAKLCEFLESRLSQSF
jgi:hypothetical protein